jgi:pimeloyl-ACP methyl ester carboxylesterase
MKKIIAICLMFASIALLIDTATAQEVEWEKKYGGGSMLRYFATDVQQTTDEGFIITGSASGQLYIVKTDSLGNQQWRRNFGGGELQYFSHTVKQTTDGGYIIFGRQLTSSSYSPWSLLLLKTNSLGNLQWKRNFSTLAPGYSEGFYGMSMQKTTDGGYIIASAYCTSPNLYPHEWSPWLLWIIKTNSSGNMQWNRTYGIWGYGQTAWGVQQTDDGYIIVGETGSYGAGSSDVWLIKTDTYGYMQWHKTFGGPAPDIGRSVQQTEDGGYIIAGITWSYGAGAYDVWLIKTDPNGNMQWNKTFGGTRNDTCWDVQQTTDGGYIIGGYTDSYGAGSSDFWLIKTDMNGEMEWDEPLGGPYTDVGYNIQQTADEGYVIVGRTGASLSSSWYTWLFKITDKPPVVIIPGFMGTTLYDDENCDGFPDEDELVWLDNEICFTDDEHLNVLRLLPNGADPLNSCIYGLPEAVNIIPGLIMEEERTICGVEDINFYGALINYLEDHGYERGDEGNLFTLPYDWRKGIETPEGGAAKLNALMEENDFSKIDIVAHSMGGLVAREFAKQHGDKIGKLIFLGTPQNGAPAIYSPFYDGELRHSTGMDFALNDETTKELVENWPGGHELLPSYGYHSLFEGVWRPNVFLFYKPYGSIWTPINRNVLYGEPNEDLPVPAELYVPNVGLNIAADNFHESFTRNEGGRKNYLLMGHRPGTITGYTVEEGRRGGLDFDILEGLGDGTVPFQSAFSMMDGYYDDIFLVEGLEHGDYVTEDEGRDVIELVSELLQNAEAPADGDLPGDIRRATDEEKSTYVKIRTASPIHLEITDSSGRVDMQIDGEPVEEIPLSSFYIFPHNEIAILGQPDDYQVKIYGYENGEYSLFINFVQDDVVVDAKAFVNVPVTERSVGSLALNLTGLSTDLTMDYDGDGTNDETVIAKDLPVIHSEPVTEAEEGALYDYAVDDEPAVQDKTLFSLDESPLGMSIDAESGYITWIAQCGPAHVAVRTTGSDGKYDTQEFDINVTDKNPPSITAPPDITVECSGEGSQAVDLGQPIAADTCCDVTVANDAPALFRLGETLVTWTALDCNGNTASATQKVTVKDTTAPQMTVSLSPAALWPPNNKMVQIVPSIQAEDVCCGSNVLVKPISVRIQDGGRNETFAIESDAGFLGEDIHVTGETILLRAKRDPQGSGRVYTITYQATDCAGNSSTASATVLSPHDVR